MEGNGTKIKLRMLKGCELTELTPFMVGLLVTQMELVTHKKRLVKLGKQLMNENTRIIGKILYDEVGEK